ncbi:MAG: GNAT family N-acetyltransferase [Pseudomonadota bacterium]
MPHISNFRSEHITPALNLWRVTEHIGLNSVDDEPARLKLFLQRNEGCSFVALADDQVVGACLCGHDLRRATIYHLAVSHPFRRGGLGRDLVAASLGALAKMGITKCHAFVFRDNPYAEHFWVAEGWHLRSELLMYSQAPDQSA